MPYKTDTRLQKFSKGEVIANSATHGIGVALSIVGLIFLITRAVRLGTTWHIVSFSIFGASLIFLYLSSTLYHSLAHKPISPILQRLDHSAIYVLIAGTYTPFLLTELRSPIGWVVFGILWGLTLIGMVLKLGLTSRFQNPSVLLYVVMGWLIVIISGRVIRTFDLNTLLLVLIGGVLYTTGILFYRWRKMAYSHAIWHGFVLAGSVLHFFGVLFIL